MLNETCALCASSDNLTLYQVQPRHDQFTESEVTLCKVCLGDIELNNIAPIEHWRCLNDSMWSQEVAIQVLVWRLLNKLKNEAWANNLLDMLYLDEDVLSWAQMDIKNLSNNSSVIHKDANGVILSANDNVTVIKDLQVKGSSLVAKRGTVVRKISLVPDNAEHIEGRVDGQKIVILTKFIKKS